MDDDVIRTRIEISKELEIINFRALLLKSPQVNNKKRDSTTTITKGKFKRWALKRNKVSPETKNTKASEPRTQLCAFQRAMKQVFVIGQLLGLNPVRGVLETDVRNMRFTMWYWRFLHCTLIGTAQAIAMALCLYRLLKESISISALGYFAFYATACVTTFFFIQIGVKWPELMKEISQCGLDQYVDPRIKLKCCTASAVIISCAIIEHFLSLLQRAAHIFDCHPDDYFYEEFSKDMFPWLFDLGVPPYILPFGIILQIINITSTINWNYSDLYIVCISMYLASILERINRKIIAASEKHHLPSSYWRALREDYNRATRLVRSFDDIMSDIIFTSFASNLFFICLQLFNILSHGLTYNEKMKHECPNIVSGPFAGYEYAAYLLFSVTYLFARSLAVSLVAASVHTATLVPAPTLYIVPASAFCDEVSRFITQVNGDMIALSGLQFFYVTRDLVLSVASTVVTYELVLLQFRSDEMHR